MSTPNKDYQPLVNCSIALNDALQAIDHHQLPNRPEALGVVASDIQGKLDLLDTATKHCDVAFADAMWLLGHIFNTLCPIDKKKKGLLPYGEWGEWCDKHGFKRQYAQEARHYAERFARHEARSLGWRGMRGTLAAEQDIEEQDANGGPEGAGNSTGKREKRKGGKKPPKEWHITRDLALQLNNALSALLSVAKKLPKAEDAVDNINKTKGILTSQREVLKNVSDAVDAVYDAFDTTDEALDKEEKTRNRETKNRTKRSDTVKRNARKA